MPIAKPFKRGGHVAGIAIVGMKMDYLISLFSSYNILERGSLVLATNDGTMIVRRPFDNAFFGKRMDDTPIYRDHVLKEKSGRALIVSSQDGVKRMNFFRRVDDYPLFVVAALAQGDILKSWRRATALQLFAMVLSFGMILLLALKLNSLCKARERLEAEIASTNRSLAQANAKLAQQASVDGMTGLSNRACLDEQGKKAIQAASRSGNPLSVIMLDVDHFKSYNDLYGHIRGDHCLKEIAAVLKEAQKRSGDLVARYGGEEFAILLPNTESDGAYEVASRLLDGIRNLRIPHHGNGRGYVTISAGICTQVPTSTTTIEEMFEHADQALYRAKNTGRDKVCDNRHGYLKSA